MDQVKKTITGFLVGIGIYGFGVELIGLIFSTDKAAYSFGLSFGLLVAVFLMLHITYTLSKALDMGEQGATKYTRKQAFLRLMIMLAAMIIFLKAPNINFIAALIGLLGLKIGSFIAAPLLKKIYPDDFVTKSEDEEVTE